MKKLINCLLLIFFPVLAFAASDGALSFTPPPGDVSMVFLGNIFGVVDGVLHGTGSQIMGQMFGVFNAAVLALGGIVIIYTLLVSTMNTAHEGQMLGQKWSSMWVPLRATLGLALLIPKTSGYCVIQILVMWIVVQGVGAADKVWSAALSYLNRGGVLVTAQANPALALLQSGGSVATGASVILSGQVCMLAIQTVLTRQREGYLNSADKDSGPFTGEPDDVMKDFRDEAVPDFLSSVNVVAYQTAHMDDDSFQVPMPNFDKDSHYAFLNGICGTIQWNAFSKNGDFQAATSNLTPSEMATASLSRAIGIQQMYMDLQAVSQTAVKNDPQLNPSTDNLTASEACRTAGTTQCSPVATEQYGVPYQTTGSPCTTGSSTCQTWGSDSYSKTAPMYNGTEFQGAILDYTAIMRPTLNLLYRSRMQSTDGSLRSTMQEANTQGWMMAGSYFFDLAQINSATPENISGSDMTSQKTDNASGLENSTFDPSVPTTPFSPTGCTGTYTTLCEWLQQDVNLIKNAMGLIDGSTFLDSPVPEPNFSSTMNPISGLASSTIYGLITNSSVIQLPGQPGLTPPAFKLKFQPDFKKGQAELPSPQFPCERFMGFCLGQALGEIFYNIIIKVLFGWLVKLVVEILVALVMLFIYIPLKGLSLIFGQALAQLTVPNINPIVGLANMGTYLINFASNLWIIVTMLIAAVAWIPFVGEAVIAVVMIAMPILLAWMVVIIGIGFICSYYIPFLPYMIFTFGSIAWLMSVIEAMVAAPIVALGITHPEGEGPFGKGEQAIMILMNVFLRPSMMIIGYIAGIILSYVSVWIINTGFARVDYFIQGATSLDNQGTLNPFDDTGANVNLAYNQTPSSTGSNGSTGYVGWAGIYGYFFSLLIYVGMYLTVVQKSFTLISLLPDKVLRWIQGGQAEQYGQDTSQWTEEEKGKVEKSGESTSKASGQMAKQAGVAGTSAAKAIKDRLKQEKPETTIESADDEEKNS